MSLTGVAVLCLLVVGVWGQCCPPDVYEITEDVYAEVRRNGTAEITRGMQRVSYDGESKRLYVHGIDYTKNIVSEVIMDYKNGKEYVWANGYCRVLPVGNFSKSCIPVAKGYIEFIVYSNFSTGIKDPSVFTPPEICHKGMSSAHIAGRRKRGSTLF
uniref:Mammalian ependymin-related protein 1 n=1 Tax=Magallana gigas TaxID=29159 RepID=A0A8W8JVC2_MAGGI